MASSSPAHARPRVVSRRASSSAESNLARAHAQFAASFADIFFNNCFKNGVLPIVLDEKHIDEIFKRAATPSPYELTVNLQDQTVEDTKGLKLAFEIDPSRKHNLLLGLDDIAETLQLEEKISAYEEARTW